MRARFDQVQPPNLVSWNDLDSGMSSTITFRAISKGRTEVEIVQRRVPDAFRSPQAQAGFLTSLDRFERYLLDLDRKDN